MVQEKDNIQDLPEVLEDMTKVEIDTINLQEEHQDQVDMKPAKVTHKSDTEVMREIMRYVKKKELR